MAVPPVLVQLMSCGVPISHSDPVSDPMVKVGFTAKKFELETVFAASESSCTLILEVGDALEERKFASLGTVQEHELGNDGIVVEHSVTEFAKSVQVEPSLE